MSHRVDKYDWFNFLSGLTLFLFVVSINPAVSQMQETPPDSPQPAATQAPAPENQPVPAEQPIRRTNPRRDTSPAITIEPLEEQPLYMNVAVYVGGGCFLVVFIGLYMIMSSTPTPGAKRLRKKKIE